MEQIPAVPQPARVLLAAGRSPLALELARQLGAAGCRIFVLESLSKDITSASRFVDKSFVVICPREHPAKFVQEVEAIVSEQQIDCIVPVWEEALILGSSPRLAPLLFAPPLALLKTLHDKWAFNQLARQLGCQVPASVLIRQASDLTELPREQIYALKPTVGRCAQSVYQFKPGDCPPPLDFAATGDFVAQAWIEGRRLCSYSVFHRGRLMVQAVYPVEFTVNGHSTAAFRGIEHEQASKWVAEFGARAGLHGQFGFDLIEQPDGQIFAIECNARATSGLHLLSGSTCFADALVGHAQSQLAGIGCRRQIVAAMLLYAGATHVRGLRSLWAYVRALFSSKDVVFSWRDLGPFLCQPLAWISLWRLARRRGQTMVDAFVADFTFDLMHLTPGATEHRMGVRSDQGNGPTWIERLAAPQGPSLNGEPEVVEEV